MVSNYIRIPYLDWDDMWKINKLVHFFSWLGGKCINLLIFHTSSQFLIKLWLDFIIIGMTSGKSIMIQLFLDSSIILYCIIEYIWILFGSFPKKNWRKEWGNPQKSQFLGFAKFALNISRNNISHHVVRNSHFAKFLSIVIRIRTWIRDRIRIKIRIRIRFWN